MLDNPSCRGLLKLWDTPKKRTVRSSTPSLEAEPRYSRTHQVASYLAEGIRTGAAEGVEPCHNVGKPNLRVRFALARYYRSTTQTVDSNRLGGCEGFGI